MRKIKILHIIEQIPIGGGAENLLWVLGKNIDMDKFNLIFCCLKNEGYIADRLKEIGFKVVCFGNYRMRYFYKKIIDIISFIKAENIDVIQTHLIYANLWGRLIAFFAGQTKICKTEHGWLFNSMRNHKFKRRIYLTIDRILDKFSDCIIYVSEAQMKAHNRGKYNPCKHVVIHNAFDEMRFSLNMTKDSARSIYGFSERDIVVGSVGRLSANKGYYYLLMAVKEVTKKHPGVKLFIVGKGDEQCRLKALAYKLRLDAVFLSDRNDVPELMRAMDIYVQPSLHESFGIGIVEAMFSGLPVVATNVGGIPEIVKDGEMGILVPPQNSKALSESLLKIIENPTMAKSMGERGSEVAVSRFTGHRYARDMEKFYISLVKEKRQ